MEEILVYSNEGPCPSQRKDKSEIVKLYWKNFKILSLKPISSKFGTKHPWIDGIQIFTNKGPHPSSRGDNSKVFFLNSTSEPLDQFQPNLA